MAEFWLGVISIELGDLDSAKKQLEHVRDRSRSEGNPVFELKADYHLAHLSCRRAQHHVGLPALLAAARAAHGRGWTEDLLYQAVFVGEALRDLGRAHDAALMWRSVLHSPSEDSDAAIRGRARRALATLASQPAPPSERTAQPLPFETVATCMATCDTADELSTRLRAHAATDTD